MPYFVSGTSLFNTVKTLSEFYKEKSYPFLQHFTIFFNQILLQFSQFAGHISMLLGVKLWCSVKVEVFLVVDGWNDKECYPLGKYW